VPYGVDIAIHCPPVAKVCWAEAKISSIPSIKAASSSNSNETASERPASPVAPTALIYDPFANLRLNLLSSIAFNLSQLGKFS
jgi:hypothetical protein